MYRRTVAKEKINIIFEKVLPNSFAWPEYLIEYSLGMIWLLIFSILLIASPSGILGLV